MFVPPIHLKRTYFIKPWCEEIEKRSNGIVKIVPYFLGAISSPVENYASVVTGWADMGESPAGIKIGRLPIMDNIMKMTTPSIRMKNATETLWNLYRNSPELQKEFSETKVLFLRVSSPLFIYTNRHVAFEQIKTLRICSPSGGLAADRIRAMVPGAVVVPNGYVYSALAKGVNEGSISEYELLKVRMWGDCLKFYHTGNISISAFYMVMNKGKWNELSPNIQKVFNEVSSDYVYKIFSETSWNLDVQAKKW